LRAGEYKRTMPSLKEIPYKAFYRPEDNILTSFYIPTLKVSLKYDRSAGYFSSTALAAAASGVSHLIQNGGRMRLLVGAELSPKDIKAIEQAEDPTRCIVNPLLDKLNEPIESLMRKRLEILAWMVSEGTLEIKVVLPTDAYGQLIPAPEAERYYHTKKGIFTDTEGNRVAFVGSVNETAQAWQKNFEEFSVHLSWEGTRDYQAIEDIQDSFDDVWEDRHPSWKALEIPEAVQRRLLDYKPKQPPKRDPVEEEIRVLEEIEEREIREREATPRERVIFQFLRDAPRLINHNDLGAATASITPWPHQLSVVRDVLDRYPEGSLLCDEVGLGKTIEAGLIIRTLLLSGTIQRCLILTPKSIQRQWQEELYEKFGLDIPRYDAGRILAATGESLELGDGNLWDDHDILLASSQLAKRRERLPQLEEAKSWDLLVIDEAHHARRRDFRDPRYRPNRLLILLETLRPKVGGLLLITATPMQVHPIEVWDLLIQLGMGGAWGADERLFLRYFSELRQSFSQIDWDFVLDLVRDQLDAGLLINQDLTHEACNTLGVPVWKQIEELPDMRAPRAKIIKNLPKQAESFLVQLARRHTPLSPYLFRNTRILLRKYIEMGVLSERIPTRKPQIERVQFTNEEQRLYSRVDTYITKFYHKYESERRGLGFVMTVYRRRLTSSFYALRRSLERRLAYLKGEIGMSEAYDDDDLEQDELSFDIEENVLSESDRQRFTEELTFVESFIQDLRTLSLTDSKLEKVKAKLNQVFLSRNKVIIFTQYTDTMDFLRAQFEDVYGSEVACYSGRGGEVFTGSTWRLTTKEEVKEKFLLGEIRILLCTEAASEGLNFQSCGVLLNYDMPWNPMRVEQRIGRIDRIGQVYDEVWITNYFYEGTIEDRIYQRLKDRIRWFEVIVGSLQPILAEIGDVTKRLAMLPEEVREEAFEQEIRLIEEKIEKSKVESLNIDEFAGEGMAALNLSSPIHLKNLESWLVEKCDAVKWRFEQDPDIPGAYLVYLDGIKYRYTFKPEIFDQHPNTLGFLTYGNKILEKILSKVRFPEPTDYGPFIRCVDERVPLVGWYQREEAAPILVNTFEDVLHGYDLRNKISDNQRDQACKDFQNHIDQLVQEKINLAMRKEDQNKRQAITRARLILLRGTYAEIMLGRRPEFEDDVGFPRTFSTDAVRSLQRHGYPWTALIQLTQNEIILPRDDDPLLQELEEETSTRLQALLKQLEDRGRTLLDEWGKLLSTFE
jgi:superfamily II DNA or RNA helicase